MVADSVEHIIVVRIRLVHLHCQCLPPIVAEFLQFQSFRFLYNVRTHFEEFLSVGLVEVVHLGLDHLVRVVEGHIVLVLVRDSISHVDFVAREYLAFRCDSVVLHKRLKKL